MCTCVRAYLEGEVELLAPAELGAIGEEEPELPGGHRLMVVGVVVEVFGGRGVEGDGMRWRRVDCHQLATG
jgi:hypothetical protein